MEPKLILFWICVGVFAREVAFLTAIGISKLMDAYKEHQRRKRFEVIVQQANDFAWQAFKAYTRRKLEHELKVRSN